MICQIPKTDFQSELDHSGPVRTSVDHSGPVWTSVDQCGPVWTSVDQCGPRVRNEVPVSIDFLRRRSKMIQSSVFQG